MLVERGADPAQVLEGQVLSLFHGHRRALVGLVEDGRGQVEGQLVGALAVHRARLLGHGLGGGGSGRQLGGPRLGRRLGVGVHVLGLLGHFLEERILLELLAHDLLELEGGELQQLDRLLQERRHHHPLSLSKGEAHGSGGSGRAHHSENFSPR